MTNLPVELEIQAMYWKFFLHCSKERLLEKTQYEYLASRTTPYDK